MNIDFLWAGRPALTLVAQFHQAFGHPISDQQLVPETLNSDLADQQLAHTTRMFNDLRTAFAEGDVVAFVDACQRLKLAVYSMELALGVPSEEHFWEVWNGLMNNSTPDHEMVRLQAASRT